LIIKKQTTSVFRINHKLECGRIPTGASQPPKNNSEVSADNHNILLYSAKKNIANVIDEYSTLYPATISASASAKSKGARFVSAKTETKKIIKTGSSGTMNQVLCSCWFTISIILNEFAQAAMGNSNSAIETSYEIICAAERSPPRKAYFELLDQPAPIIL